MDEFHNKHSTIKWTLIALSILILILVVGLSLVDWNVLRPTIAARITAATGRAASINGDLKVHLWSWNPTAQVNNLEIKNPSWADRDLMFGAKQITISVSLGHLLRGQLVLPQVDLRGPVINLERDDRERASWELGTPEGTPNHNTKPAKVPTIKRLIIEDGELHVVDKIRKLTFSGTLVAAERAGKEDSSALKILCAGSLNAKPFHLEAHGGPLLGLEPHKPYGFSAHVTASDIDLKTEVTVLTPFDLGRLHIGFIITGNDLADVYYLTGLALPNTPSYRLAATVDVDGTEFKVRDLKGRLGKSDIIGTATVQTARKQPKLTANLSSATLNIADLAPTLGKPAPKATSLSANPATETKPPTAKLPSARTPAVPVANPVSNDGHLLPDADLQVKRVRGMDADVRYQAASVIAPKVPMRHVQFHLTLSDGVLSMDPLSFVLDRGKFSGKVKIDAHAEVPVSDIDMQIDNIDLSQFKSATMKQAPLEGTLMGRFKLHGTGTSVHKFASSSDGALSVVIPHGELNEALAELTGINVLRGLGLLLSKGDARTEVRCGIIDFKDQQGMLKTTTVYLDTTNVLITGRGDINLNNEALNLELQGDPKKLRLLRLRSPVTLTGTLLKPAVGVKADKLAEQAGVAAALGAVLTPVAAAIAFIDPGLAKNKDCSSLLAQADAGVSN
jgi:uncharacterized protein involved in outer membrane biogenesis